MKPQLDAFALESNKRCDEWYGPDNNKAPDSFNKKWGCRKMLWMNQPFSVMWSVSLKMKEDQSHAVLTTPDWKCTRWYSNLQQMEVASALIPEGFSIFEFRGQPCKETRWGVKFWLICGHDPKFEWHQLQASSLSKAQKRKMRKRRAAKKWAEPQLQEYSSDHESDSTDKTINARRALKESEYGGIRQ